MMICLPPTPARRVLAFVLLLMLPLVFPAPLAAAPYPPMSFLGIEHGLSNNTVRCVYQDHKGFMWFGTFDGLSRYDGNRFKVFRNRISDPTSLVHNIILAITEDSLRNLWVGTRQGISRMEPLLGRFATVQYKPNAQAIAIPLNVVVKDIRTDQHNNVFIATEGMGLFMCTSGNLLAQAVPLRNPDGSVVSTPYTIKAVRVDAQNRVWAQVQKKGLARYNPQTKVLELVNEAIKETSGIVVDGNDLWICTNTTLHHYNTASNTLKEVLNVKEMLAGNSALNGLAFDADKRCWLVTNGGQILSWKAGEATASFYGKDQYDTRLNGAIIYNIYIDRQARKWMGTSRYGIGMIDPHKARFQVITHQAGNSNSLVDNAASALYEARDGSIYIGTDGGGLNIWDRATNRFSWYGNQPDNPASPSGNAIVNIKEDQSQQVWMTTFGQGVNRFDPTTKRSERYYLFNAVANNESKVAYALLADHANRLWVSSLRQNSLYGALFLLNRSLNKFEVFDAELSDLFTLYEDKQHTLWGGNLTQLVQIDPITKKHRFYNMGNAVRCIKEDSKGRFWVGTEGGGLLLLNRSNYSIEERYTTEKGLCNDVVLTIVEDGSGQLWISTFSGLSKFDPDKRTFKNYYQEDGLQSNQFHFNSALVLRSGELAFGGIKGVSLFHPAVITPTHSMPALQLTDIYINNKPVSAESGYIKEAAGGDIQTITVPYKEAVFGFRYTALEYSAAAKINYAYYMDGWDRGWNNTANLLTAAYTHLDEGTYTFRVKSTNEAGEWNPQQIALRIIVLPPWYRSWWAYALYMGAVAGAIYIFLRYKTRQNRLHYEVKVAQLQTREAQLQTKEAQLVVQQEKEVHEKRLAFFTHVSHEFRTPLTLIIDPVKEMLQEEKDHPHKDGLNRVHRNARRLLGLVDQLLLFRKAETESDSLRVTALDLHMVCQDVFDCFVHQARIKRIDYTLQLPADPVTVYADRDKLEIMLFNLLSNAIKFTPLDGKVRLSVTASGEHIEIAVYDSGVGIPEGTGDKLFNRFYQVKGNQLPSKTGFGIGLYLVKHFASLHHGSISYESRTAPSGTTFLLTLLKGHDHFKPADIFTDVQPAPVIIRDTEPVADTPEPGQSKDLANIVTEMPTMLVVDDDEELRRYISQVFSQSFNILEAVNGREGLNLAAQYLPDLIISDITMEELGGLELCRQVKEDLSLSHIPVILLTASTSSETRLKGIEAGADDYITKPFEKELLKARAVSLLKKRNSLQQYFYNEITLQQNDQKVSVEYREFLERCIRVVEEHLDDETFSIKTLTTEMGMSRSSLYRKVNSVSGQSIVGFIRFIRLRKAAELMINTENNVTEIASVTGFNDIKYFRTHFNQLFGMNPKEYIQRYRKPFHNNLQLNQHIIKPE